MKRFLLLSLLFLVVGGVNLYARTTRTLEFKFTDPVFEINYTGTTNSVDTETGELSLGDNSSCAWNRYYQGTKFDLSGSDRFVVKLKEAATKDLYVLINQKGFWETVGNDESNANDGVGYVGVLPAGETKLIIKLTGLKSNRPIHTGTAIDLSDIWMINLWSELQGNCTYKIDEIYAERVESDQVIETPISDITSFNWEDAQIPWGSEYTTLDKEEKTITITQTAWNGNGAVSWLNGEATDIFGYDRLVLELEEASNGAVEVVVSDDGFWGHKCHSAILAQGQTKLVLTLTDLTITGTPQGEDTWEQGDPLDLEHVNLIFIRTDLSVDYHSIHVKDFYFEKTTSTSYHVMRENTVANKFGTICLPFAAAIPSNATVYEIVNYSETEGTLHLESVDEMEAGKAYIFKSHDTEDITFTKVGTATDLVSPAVANNGLIGTFSATTIPAASNYWFLSSNSLYDTEGCTGDDAVTIGVYRAYININAITNKSTTSSTMSKRRAVLFFGDGTTGINNTKAVQTLTSGKIYDLSGREVTRPTRGLYIVGGQKAMIK